jgi:hypothetical protein
LIPPIEEKDNNFLIEKSQLKSSQIKENGHIPKSVLINPQDDLSASLKNKIYFWLTDLGILKENSIKADDLPNLCANGVLLADLVNRLEGVK